MAKNGVTAMEAMESDCERWMVLLCAVLNQLAVDIGDRLRAGKPENDPIVQALLRQSVPVFEFVQAWCPTCAYASPAGLLRLARWQAARSSKFVRDYKCRRTADVVQTGNEEPTAWQKRRRAAA